MLNSPLTFSVWFHKVGRNPISCGQERSNTRAVAEETSPRAGGGCTEWLQRLRAWTVCGWERWRWQLACVASAAISRKGSISDMGACVSCSSGTPLPSPPHTHTRMCGKQTWCHCTTFSLIASSTQSALKCISASALCVLIFCPFFSPFLLGIRLMWMSQHIGKSSSSLTAEIFSWQALLPSEKLIKPRVHVKQTFTPVSSL